MKVLLENKSVISKMSISNKSLKLYIHTQLVSAELKSTLAESGRSMVEMIGALVIMGVLSIGGVMGYRHALNKSTANRLMKDVETAYVSVNAMANREAGVLTKVDFEPSSGYLMWTELISDEEFRIDIILAKNIPETVCNMILEMTENTQWVISSIETDTNYLYPLKECAKENALVFSLGDVSNFAYSCEKECPPNMMCVVNDNCICETGFEMNETGECITKTCDLTLGPEAQPDRYCCEQLGGRWNYDTSPQMCGCAEGYFFNGKECAIDNWCSYIFKVPEIVQTVQSDCAYDFMVPAIVQTVQSDCAYDFTVPATVVAGETEVSMSPVAGKTCSDGYCILNWNNEKCTSGVSYGTNTTTRIYGRCAPFDEYHTICKNKTDGEVSMSINRPCQIENTYCSVLWGNNTCKGIGQYGANTHTELYGVCLEYDGVGDMICPFK